MTKARLPLVKSWNGHIVSQPVINWRLSNCLTVQTTKLHASLHHNISALLFQETSECFALERRPHDMKYKHTGRRAAVGDFTASPPHSPPRSPPQIHCCVDDKPECPVLVWIVLCWSECPPALLCFSLSGCEPCLPQELLSSGLISSDLWGGREWGEARLYSYPGWITAACGYQDWASKPPPLPAQTHFTGCEKTAAARLSYLFADWNDHDMSLSDQIWYCPNGISLQLRHRLKIKKHLISRINK